MATHPCLAHFEDYAAILSCSQLVTNI